MIQDLIQRIEQLKARISDSRHIVALTGAGVSAESGVPTFRGKNGLWKDYRAEDLATPDAFARNPELVWEWYDWRRQLIASVTYNPAHRTLVELEKKSSQFTLITQNVDGLHKKAGSINVLEIHGSIWKLRCTLCSHVSENYKVPLKTLPYCSMCGGLLRPHVVWFGEPLPTDVLVKADNALNLCDLLMVIGTSGVVQPVASFPYYARARGAFVLEVNVEPSSISPIAHETILGKAGEILPLFLQSEVGKLLYRIAMARSIEMKDVLTIQEEATEIHEIRLMSDSQLQAQIERVERAIEMAKRGEKYISVRR